MKIIPGKEDILPDNLEDRGSWESRVTSTCLVRDFSFNVVSPGLLDATPTPQAWKIATDFESLECGRENSCQVSMKLKKTLAPWKESYDNSRQCIKKQRHGEGNGTPLQYFCLENPMDGGAW